MNQEISPRMVREISLLLPETCFELLAALHDQPPMPLALMGQRFRDATTICNYYHLVEKTSERNQRAMLTPKGRSVLAWKSMSEAGPHSC